MATFKDINGKEWAVRLDAPLIKILRTVLKFDIVNDEEFQRLGNDAVLLTDTLYLLCRDQAPGITEEDFCKAIGDGDVLGNAEQALEVAYLNFSPPRKRSMIASLRKEQGEILSEGMELAKTKVTDGKLRKGFLDKLEAEMDQAISKVLAGPIFVTSSPGSSDSGPTG
jgi:hypothetical protein